MLVKFIKDGKVITKVFDSEFRCRKFVERAKRSSKINLIQWPNFK